MATGAGVVLALMGWKILVLLLVVFFAVAAITRYVSLGSVAISMAFPLLVAWLHRGNTAYILFAVLAGGLVMFNHRANLRRLMVGRELKMGEKADGPTGPNA